MEHLLVLVFGDKAVIERGKVLDLYEVSAKALRQESAWRF